MRTTTRVNVVSFWFCGHFAIISSRAPCETKATGAKDPPTAADGRFRRNQPERPGGKPGAEAHREAGGCCWIPLVTHFSQYIPDDSFQRVTACSCSWLSVFNGFSRWQNRLCGAIQSYSCLFC